MVIWQKLTAFNKSHFLHKLEQTLVEKNQAAQQFAITVEQRVERQNWLSVILRRVKNYKFLLYYKLQIKIDKILSSYADF